MANGYSWHDVQSDGGDHLPGPEHMGWWVVIAVVLSLLLHVIVFLVLGRMGIGLSFNQAKELRTNNIHVQQVEVRPTEDFAKLNPEDKIEPPKDSARLLDEIDVLEALPRNAELEMKPDVDKASFAVRLENPAMKGEPAVVQMENTAESEIDSELPEMGTEPLVIKPAEMGQVTVDPGSMVQEDDLGKFTDELIRKGAGGKVDKGLLDGVTSLDGLLGLPADVLVSKTTMLPSDLLFEYNKSDLRESAKVGLMKLALLIDRNPDLYCWIEGHTDLFGGDDFNRELSVRRAEAVKTYLVRSLRMNEQKIITRGFGRSLPLVKAGSAADQAPNRRVEIRMRKTLPPTQEPVVEPKAPPAPEMPPAPPQAVPKAVLVTPRVALPVEELAPPVATPRALPVVPDADLPED